MPIINQTPRKIRKNKENIDNTIERKLSDITHNAINEPRATKELMDLPSVLDSIS